MALRKRKSLLDRGVAAVLPYVESSISISLAALALVLIGGFVIFTHRPAIQQTAGIRQTSVHASAPTTAYITLKGVIAYNAKLGLKGATIMVKSPVNDVVTTAKISLDSSYFLGSIPVNSDAPTIVQVAIKVPGCEHTPFRIIVPAVHDASYLIRNFDATCNTAAQKPIVPLKIR